MLDLLLAFDTVKQFKLEPIVRGAQRNQIPSEPCPDHERKSALPLTPPTNFLMECSSPTSEPREKWSLLEGHI